MKDDKFEKLMEELRATWRDMDQKLKDSIADVEREVSTAQKWTTKKIQRKLNKPSYRFRHKGMEMQHNFNVEVEDSISAACQELGRMTESEDRSMLERAAEYLEEGACIKMRKKLIKVADRSKFGWGAARHYQADPLADDSDNEKELRRVDKAARRDFEDRKPRGGKRGRRYAPYGQHYQDSWDNPGPSGKRDLPLSAPRPLMSLPLQRQTRPRTLGPCFSCGMFGHLARTCPTKGR